jgi:ATP-dependent Clp protease adapter protein ClpS
MMPARQSIQSLTITIHYAGKAVITIKIHDADKATEIIHHAGKAITTKYVMMPARQ